MRRRLAVPVTILLALPAALLTACGGDDKASDRVDPGVEMDAGSSSGSKDSGSKDSDSKDSGSKRTDDTLFEEGAFDDASKAIEGMLGEECAKAYQAFLALAAAGFGSEAEAKAAVRRLEDLKKDLPKDLAADIDVMAKAYATIAKEGLIAAGEMMDTPEFERASENVTKYFDRGCTDE